MNIVLYKNSYKTFINNSNVSGENKVKNMFIKFVEMISRLKMTGERVNNI